MPLASLLFTHTSTHTVTSPLLIRIIRVFSRAIGTFCNGKDKRKPNVYITMFGGKGKRANRAKEG